MKGLVGARAWRRFRLVPHLGSQLHFPPVNPARPTACSRGLIDGSLHHVHSNNETSCSYVNSRTKRDLGCDFIPSRTLPPPHKHLLPPLLSFSHPRKALRSVAAPRRRYRRCPPPCLRRQQFISEFGKHSEKAVARVPCPSGIGVGAGVCRPAGGGGGSWGSGCIADRKGWRSAGAPLTPETRALAGLPPHR